jgi:hypothetical protein
LIGSTVHFQPSEPLRAKIVDSKGVIEAGVPKADDLEVEASGGFRAISRRWKYAPETTSAMMMIDCIG